MKKYYLIFLSIIAGFVSCEDFLEPIPEGNRLTEEQLMNDPAFVEGLLLKAYVSLPNNYNNFDLDVASDDAVTNLQGSAITEMATGSWTSSFNPISEWSNAFEQIRHINLFIERYEKIVWAFTPVLTKEQNAEKNKFMLQRFKGEAYGLRAYFQALLLQYHGGKAPDGTLLGFPIITAPIKPTDNWKLPRATYAQCVQQIMSDIDTAVKYLPAVYANLPGQSMYNEAIGAKYENRMTGFAARALKARVALQAASPAFSAGSGISWGDAAKISGELLKDLGAVTADGKTFYVYNAITRPKEIIWERAVENLRSAEINNFPPSLFGNGRTNPTQSLVDAFPMKNGYPINYSDVLVSGFDANNPYALRDTRLGDFILFNGSVFKNDTIKTFAGAPLNGVGTLETSTRTGYYIKKFMLPTVSLTPGSLVSSPHTYTLFRMAEVLLNYAEAANEAWGITGDPHGYGFSAQSKIRELRNRAGIPVADPYLYSLTDTPGLRELIKNERRVELCFEGFRFWDIRRWDNAPANIVKPATGVLITNEAGVLSYQYLTVEPRVYSPHMIYGPIPYDETLKYDIVQNAGW